MPYFPHGAFAAIHAAHEQRRQDEEEELFMTRYTIDELDSDWEFKIVRSDTAAFRKLEVFDALLQEESQAGWELVEKLDDRRVRFKRRRDARRRDATLPPAYDPYRTRYGGSSVGLVVILASVGLLLAVGIAVAVLSASGGFPETFGMIAAAIGLIFILLAAALAVILRSRK